MNNLNIGTVTTGITFNPFSYTSERVDVYEIGETIQFIYKETSSTSNSFDGKTVYPPRIFKIVYSCKQGKWHKSDRIYGEIIPATEEQYFFNE